MKKLLLILFCLPFIGFGQNVNIPDANFKAYLVGNSLINTNNDTEIQVSEAAAFNGTIYCNGIFSSNLDLTGIEAFTALTKLWCQNNTISTLNISNNTMLTTLYCWNNQLTSLDVSNNTALGYLNCSHNQLTSLDLSNNTNLTELNCYNNQLTSLDLSNNTALGYLNCSYNEINTLDVSQNVVLGGFECSNNQLTTLDLSNNTALHWVSCNTNLLTCLEFGPNTALDSVGCRNNLLEQLNIKNTTPNYIYATNNNLSCIEADTLPWTYFEVDSGVVISTNCNYTNPCTTTSSIQEHTTNKELLKITDLLGRETKQTNQPLFYIYDDGTVEKRIVIE